ncbi:hypothetical protein ACB092_11G183800 [Castanea dentata]
MFFFSSLLLFTDLFYFGSVLIEKFEGANHGGSAALSFSHLDLSPLHSLSLILLDPVISLFDLSFLC